MNSLYEFGANPAASCNSMSPEVFLEVYQILSLVFYLILNIFDLQIELTQAYCNLLDLLLQFRFGPKIPKIAKNIRVTAKIEKNTLLKIIHDIGTQISNKSWKNLTSVFIYSSFGNKKL